MRWIKIEDLEQGTTWLNIEKLYQIYIDTSTTPAKVLAYRTKTEVEHYRVSDETREYLERILNANTNAGAMIATLFKSTQPPPATEQPEQPEPNQTAM